MLRAASLSLVSRSMWRASPASWMFAMTPNNHSSLSATGWSCGGPTKAGPTRLLRALYRKLGYERLPGLIKRFSTRMGVTPGKLRVWELHNRWASCSLAGNLNFHWRVMALPLDVLEYLVAHELAHLKHRNHTKEFWGEVEKAYPQWQSAAEWLRGNGAGRTL